MATLLRKSGKTPGYEIQFYEDGRRVTLYLGGRRYSERTAEELKTVVETLVYVRDNSLSTLDRRTLAWIETASPDIRAKLTKAGLIETPAEHTLGELWAAFLEQKTDVKKTTMSTYRDAEDWFFRFFKGGDAIQEITQLRMKEWQSFLLESLAKTTTAKVISRAKSVFNWAASREWIEKSPLDGVGRGSFVNREKDRFIEPSEYRRLLDVCPCQDWRAIIALARYGGLRCPSEVLRLRWSDINWERSRFYVRSPKTERHEGKDTRLVPLFPEVREELETLFFDPESEGREFVINRYRRPNQNLGTTFAKIVTRAGIEPIEKPFNNMRSSRSTEVYAEFGAFLESRWIGHSQKIARDHYLQVREEDFERAADSREKTPCGNFPANFPAVRGCNSLQGPARQETKKGRKS